MLAIESLPEDSYRLVTPHEAAQQGMWPRTYMMYTKKDDTWNDAFGLHESGRIILGLGGTITDFDPIDKKIEGWNVFRVEQNLGNPPRFRDYLVYGVYQLRRYIPL